MSGGSFASPRRLQDAFHVSRGERCEAIRIPVHGVLLVHGVQRTGVFNPTTPLMNLIAVTLEPGLQGALSEILGFAARALLFLVILIVGYFVAKLIGRIVNKVLERVGFDRLVERGGVKRALAKSKWDASDILAKTAFYFVMLCVLQLAFGVFGPNPISDMLTAVMAYLPHLFVAAIIIVVVAALAAGAKQLLEVSLGGLSYGKALATGASVAIWTIGVFAALSQLQIAPAIVNGLFFAMLAVLAGSLIIAIGGGGIAPMRGQWERFLGVVEKEAPRVAAEAENASGKVHNRIEEWKEIAAGDGNGHQEPKPARSKKA